MKTTCLPKNSVVEYVRDDNREPFGAFVSLKTEDGFSVGYARCNRKDHFVKRKALTIAIGRAMVSNVESGNIHPEMVQYLPHFVERCHKYYRTKGRTVNAT